MKIVIISYKKQLKILMVEGMSMKFCPECGIELGELLNEVKKKSCKCGFIDWDNWVNIGVVTVAYNENKEFAMVTLKGNEENKITFPGGFREMGESLEEAAAREYFEETGYEINNLELFRVYTYDEKRLIWVAFRGELGKGEFIENTETKAINFHSKDNLPNEDYLRGPLTRRLYKEIIS